MTQHESDTAGETRGLDPALGPDSAQRAGTFRFWFAEQRWEWSEGVARMHGYPAEPMEPSLDVVLGHKHPEDRAQVAGVLAKSVAHGAPFCSRHRIVDTTGQTRHVIVVADSMTGDDGQLVGSAGYYVDLTTTLAEERQETLQDTLPELFAARAVIEQAKGALMLVYGISSEQAFRVLIWRSQETNTKLRALAQRLVAELSAIEHATPALRTEFDHILLTVHERIDRV
ncbi:PAS and ANTAR domain-containing protein [Nocardia flavorosea]|uniref:PAS and ANTAR domain-containing protein n=1 Tax=Nocardia flavorosea TaxID=53429 RepID=UPI002B4B741F|nr:PAS and ANTAR domain-containing protein [Nocardia flavorosea]